MKGILQKVEVGRNSFSKLMRLGCVVPLLEETPAVPYLIFKVLGSGFPSGQPSLPLLKGRRFGTILVREG